MKKVKYLHLIRPSKELSYPIMKMINENFDIEEHQFFITTRLPMSQCECFLEFPNVDLFLKGRNRLEKIIYFIKKLISAETIILHGIYWSNDYLLFFNLFSSFLKKCVWVAWGMDLYGWKIDISKLVGKEKIKAKIINKLSYRARVKIDKYVSIFPPDGNVMKNSFNRNAQVIDATYTSISFKQEIEENRLKKQNIKYTNIMVGHNANVWNNHKQLLDMLIPYRYENIRLYIVLSTGISNAYANEVENYAKLLFGKKAICIRKKMTIGNYIKFVDSMDVIVFKLYRQAALGNIMRLLYMKKKVFLPAESVMYDFFRRQGCAVYDTNLIGKLDFNEFIRPIDGQHSTQYMEERCDLQNIVKMWSRVFDYSRKDAPNVRKYLHIVSPSEETYEYVTKINKYFETCEHEFLFLPGLNENGQRKIVGEHGLNYSIVENKSKKTRQALERKVKDFSYIILHDFIITKERLEFFSSYEKYSDKLIGTVKISSEVIGNTLLHSKATRMQGIVKENTRKFEEILAEPTISALDMKFLSNMSKIQTKNRSSFTNVLVGTNGKRKQNHIGILNSIANFRYEKIRVFVDLSKNDDQAYANGVKNYAQKLFGNKVFFITKEYDDTKKIKLWNLMDLVILRLYDFDEWECILKIMFLNKKLFLPSGTVMYNYLVNKGGSVFDSKAVYISSIEDLLDVSTVDNKKVVQSIINENFTIEKKWNKVFEMLEAKEHEL